jgi:hypothetical protein
MTSLMEQEKQRIPERLARLDAERQKLGDQLNELITPNVFWPDSGGKRLPPRSGVEHARRGLRRRPVRRAKHEAANRFRTCR